MGAERLVGAEEGVDLGDVDPEEQVRVAGPIGASALVATSDPLVDRTHPGDGRLGVLDRPVGRRRDVVARPLQAPHGSLL